jgi:hypothetical protein
LKIGESKIHDEKKDKGMSYRIHARDEGKFFQGGPLGFSFV